MSLWLRWWLVFPAASLLGIILLFVIGLEGWNPWLQTLSIVAVGVLATRIVPEIMWDGDPKPPLRRRHDAAPSGRS